MSFLAIFDLSFGSVPKGGNLIPLKIALCLVLPLVCLIVFEGSPKRHFRQEAQAKQQLSFYCLRNGRI
jgi:hypothetical protein